MDSEITGVHFRDGAMVQQGDLLFTLDSRAIEAQVRQVEGLLAGAKAKLEQAERDVARYTELLAKNATTLVTLQNARTQIEYLARLGRFQHGATRKSEHPAQLLHHPGADCGAGQHGLGQGRQLRARRPILRRLRPSSRLRRST